MHIRASVEAPALPRSARSRRVEVTPQQRIVTVTSMNGEENTSTTVFTEHDGRTTVTNTMLFASKASRDQAVPYAKSGTGSSYARLDAYLESKN